METMKPMAASEAWWPKGLGEPSTSGGRNGLLYAFFPDKRRLLVERDGATTLFGSGELRIDGAHQRSDGDPDFSTDEGSIRLADLLTVSR